MSASYNANLFEMKVYKPLTVNVYAPEIDPKPQKPAQFYQLLGRLANMLTKSMQTAIISDEGKLKVLELEIPEDNLRNEIELENIAKFNVTLKFERKSSVNFAESQEEYKKLVNQIIDIAMVRLSNEYYKYSERSPYVMERGEGYFEESLRKEVGIEDGRRFYRGVRILDGIPCLVINREIELRSWKNLLNELKILAEWWGKHRQTEIDFYNPPKEFISFVNWLMRNKTGSVKLYPAPTVIIREITWDVRAKDKIIDGSLSLVEYQKQARGIVIQDESQPVVKWKHVDRDGKEVEQFHLPELLVIGHTFHDLSMRISKSKISQVFDVIHPHCGDQQRRIYDFVRKADTILRKEFSIIYPSKVEFSLFPKDVTKNVTELENISLQFKEKAIKIEPPFGVNFYKKYSKTLTFVKPLTKKIKALAVYEDPTHSDFIMKVKNEVEKRNGCKLSLKTQTQLDFDKTISDYELILTISDEENVIKECKEVIINKYGVAHQNVNTFNAQDDSISALAMQVTLKLGGYPWLLAEPIDAHVLSIKSYTNPFTSTRFYMFNLMSPEGIVIYQSEPFKRDDVLNFLREIRSQMKSFKKLLIMITFDDQQIEEYIAKELPSDIKEFMLVQIKQDDEVRIFSTYHASPPAARRRRRETAAYPIEAYEAVPQGVALKMSNNEYYIVTTSSTKVGTYYRGCPTPIRINIISSQGLFDVKQVIQYILSLCLVSGTSGHETRLPAPLYYLALFGYYVNQYGVPSDEKTFKNLFYV